MASDLSASGNVYLNGQLTAGGTVYSTWPATQTWNGINDWQRAIQVPSQFDYSSQQQEMMAAMQRLQALAPKVEERKPMRGLFEVFVVNPESGEIEARDVVVADNDKKAELKVMRALDVDPDDVDIIVRRLGDVRQKRHIQEVKVVKDG